MGEGQPGAVGHRQGHVERAGTGRSRRPSPTLERNIPPYVLRHSSIVRWLRSGTHAEIVADLHDTSTEMLSQTYGADMASKAEDILRERLKGMGSLTSGATVSRLKAV